eukprot:COSAG01_NODE_36928_length_510_cov_9.875912_2_plen_85_part_01
MVSHTNVEWWRELRALVFVLDGVAFAWRGRRLGVVLLVAPSSDVWAPLMSSGSEGLDALWQTSISTLFSVVGEEHGVEQGQVLSL